MTGHLLRETAYSSRTELSCSCGEWSVTSPFRLGEVQHEIEQRAMRRQWLDHIDGMMKKERQMKLEDFCAKVEHEGGIIDALRYGLKAEDLSELNDPLACELRDVWEALEHGWQTLARLESEAERIVSEVLDAEEDE